MIGLFKKIQPSISVPLFYVFVTIALVVRFLIASVFGAFALAIFAYWYIGQYTAISPFTGHELLIWFGELEPAYRVAFFGSLVTVLGFVVAFHTATVNWRNQMKAQLKSDAAGEIENFFAIVGRSIRGVQLYVDDLVDTANLIQNGGDPAELSFRVRYAQGRGEQFIAARNTLSQASIEVHRLISKNHNLLASGWGLLSAVQGTAETLADVVDKIWIRVPIVDVNDPNHVQHFLDQINVTDCQSLSNACDINDSKIAAMSGGLQGALLAPVWGFSFPMYVTLLRDRRAFREAMNLFHRDQNSES